MNRLMKDFMKVIPRPVSRKASRFSLNPLVAGSIEEVTSEIPYTTIYRLKVDLGSEVAIPNHAVGSRFAAEQVCGNVCRYLYGDIYEKLHELRLALMECQDDSVLHEKISELLEMSR